MRSRLWQFGSGQAISASRRHPVVGVGRTLLGGQQRQDRRERIDRDALARRQGQHLALEFEIVARARAAIDLRARGARPPRPAGPKARSFRRSRVRSSLFRRRSRLGARGDRRPSRRSTSRAGPATLASQGLQTIGGWSKINDQFGVMSGDGADAQEKPSSGDRPVLVGEVSGQAFRRRRRSRRRHDRRRSRRNRRADRSQRRREDNAFRSDRRRAEADLRPHLAGWRRGRIRAAGFAAGAWPRPHLPDPASLSRE